MHERETFGLLRIYCKNLLVYEPLEVDIALELAATKKDIGNAVCRIYDDKLYWK